MDSPATNYLQLELHVPDFEQVKSYYGALGFKVVWERIPEEAKGYLVIERDGTVLCFWGGNDTIFEQTHFKRFPKDTPRGYGVELVIMVDDISAFYESVKDGANVVEPLITQPWGLQDFRAIDPFGYYLRFTSKHDILDKGNAVD
jgi:predicted enzyme related to lactoylglutathione lyase